MPLILLILLLWAAPASAQIKFEATVDRNSARVGDQVKLILEVQGAASGVPVPVTPSFAGLDLVGGPFRSSELQVINGKMTGSIKYTYILRAETPGSGAIGPSTLTFRGKQYATRPIKIEIVDAGTTAPQGASSEKAEDVFVRVHADKRQVYRNEKVVLTYTIFFRSSITSPDIVRLPRTAGFWVEEFSMPRDLPVREQVVNGLQYRTAVFKKIALFPTQTGELTVEPLVLRTQVQVRAKRRDRFSLFDDPFFGLGARTETREIRSPSVTVQVKPLPERGRPADFNGAVGDFKIASNLDRETCAAHEAVTLACKIWGEGNIKTLAEPTVSFPPDIEHYDPKVSDDIRRSRDRVHGSKTFEYLLIPRAAGVQHIPPVSYSFFNPKTARYYRLSTDKLELTVEKAEETGGGNFGIPVATKRGVEQIGEDIAYVKVKSDMFRRRGVAPYEEVTFWLVLCAPWAAVAMVFTERRRREKLGEAPLRERNLRAPGRARKGFARAQRLLGPGQEEAFYGSVSHILYAYLAARLNWPANDFTSLELEEAWREQDWPSEILEKAQQTLAACDFARFASGTPVSDERGEILKEAREVVEAVERLISAKGRKA
jgi:hypothetical protein